jgi:1,4-dihydroxy-2-naphthoate octaprenyltransferase
MLAYLKALRAPFLSGSLMPVLLTGAWAYSRGSFAATPFLLCLLGVGSLHVAANLINDWADSAGSDPINVRLTPFSGGSRVIQNGDLTRNQVLYLCLFFYGLAAFAGFCLTFGHPWVPAIGALGFLIGFLYSTGPFPLMSRGLGEVGIFFAFGPLITLGTYYVMADHLSLQAFLLGLPLGFLITAVIWINQFPDYQADRSAGKNNLVVRLGLEKAKKIYPMLMYGSLVSLFFLVIVGLPGWLLAGLGTAPLIVKACRYFALHYDHHPEVAAAQALTIQTQLAMGALTAAALFLAGLAA